MDFIPENKKFKNSPETNLEIGISAKPFLKWAGGKGQLLNTFLKYYPEELITKKISNYYEPFVGGGAVFFDIAQRFDIQSAFLFDINEELILTYRVVQKDVFKLIDFLEHYKKEYNDLNDKEQSDFFYKLRQDFNQQRDKINFNRYSESWIFRAAQTIFLNKTCFNGLFRFNSKGGFNVPKGRYKNPKILDVQNLLKVSKLLSIADIKKADFKEVEKKIKHEAFVYYDPPYRPISKTSSFTSYSKNGFTDSDQIELAAMFQRLHLKGVKQMLSNSDPKNNNEDDNFFDELYKSHRIFRVPARRMINSNATRRNAINEIVVTNYLVN
ncbi:MAG: Dam family site-specific DNA-(adenine-N6)-methyltransferase [Prolixibacteraceae bacterium]|jgi:DNA adenine methylase|nr:Dam family site-specific DNA-(adenine-N6)-methyltransferase [Prolixibacteraceae bacterium]MBT6006867.1 Dam family site-specific DNA-(adenine-N6)-methyltransferase [Prolixibacteraceae bacterium]MBT6765438.1 Dam family site-specific DNA-(adenine-N6)-methyltransferase [Prolixibacteraceae bacterium]MBT6999192.1 Dam family site-specific DNA-(adenine-N6)-methyltransferase [Prolixibacteraceae bacterium]MBT7396532.1 Dam family site-specific DNA-(adenine-N6)-methyltransferase [Prolixibacteraceae bact